MHPDKNGLVHTGRCSWSISVLAVVNFDASVAKHVRRQPIALMLPTKSMYKSDTLDSFEIVVAGYRYKNGTNKAFIHGKTRECIEWNENN